LVFKWYKITISQTLQSAGVALVGRCTHCVTGFYMKIVTGIISSLYYIVLYKCISHSENWFLYFIVN